MKITKTSVAVIALSALFFSCGNPAETEKAVEKEEVMEETVEKMVKKSTINTETSVVKWEGSIIGVYSHSGTVHFNSGTIELEDGNLVNGEFEVDLTSMKPTDENYKPKDGKTPEKLVEHLSSADFFDVANYPTASFKVKSVEDNVATGTLTVRGKSSEETVENVVVSDTEEGMSLSGTLTFDRTKYDVAFVHPAKEVVVSNDITLNIEIHAEAGM